MLAPNFWSKRSTIVVAMCLCFGLAVWLMVWYPTTIPIGRTTHDGKELFLGESSSDAIARLGLRKMSMPEPAGYFVEHRVNDSTVQYIDMTFSCVTSRVSSISIIETVLSTEPLSEVIATSKARLVDRLKGSICTDIVRTDFKPGDLWFESRCVNRLYTSSYEVAIEYPGFGKKYQSYIKRIEFFESYWTSRRIL